MAGVYKVKQDISVNDLPDSTSRLLGTLRSGEKFEALELKVDAGGRTCGKVGPPHPLAGGWAQLTTPWNAKLADFIGDPPQALLLTLHVGEKEPDGEGFAVDVVCANVSGDELARVRMRLDQPMSALWSAIGAELGQDAAALRTMLPNGCVLDDGEMLLDSAFGGAADVAVPDECLDMIRRSAEAVSNESLEELKHRKGLERVDQDVLETVFLLLGAPRRAMQNDAVSWDSLEKMIAHPKFVDGLRKFNFKDKVDLQTFKRLREMLQSPDLNAELVFVCPAVASLALWCRSIGVYLSKTKFPHHGPEIRPVATWQLVE